MGAGIDYGMGRSNRDPNTGIRYGVISQHSVLQAWADSAEPDYGAASCPKCGNDAIACDSPAAADNEEYESGHGCADWQCDSCAYVFDSQDAYGDEPRGWNYEGDGYKLVGCLDSDIMVLQSPFYTFAEFCSPCVPGAGNLDSAIADGAQTYCLGHDWFESGRAPYPVYSVETGLEVAAPAV